MEVIRADTAGFCMGVRRAVELALNAAADPASPRPIHTLGPLIHNRQVAARLHESGIDETADLPAGGTLIIRAHGVRPELIDQARTRGLRVIDATCPHVCASQKIIRRESAAGRQILIAGDRDHPEVLGLAGYSTTPVRILSTLDDIRTIVSGSYALIAQTTFKASLYAEMTHTLKSRLPDLRSFPTICDATNRRQEEALRLARDTSWLVVAGDRHSANTYRLAEVGLEAGARVYHVEEASELRAEDFPGCQRCGLTAGASTPDWIIDAIEQLLHTF